VPRSNGTFGSVEQLPSGHFRARYRGPDGRRYTAPTTFFTLRDARGWLALRQSEIIRKAWAPPEATPKITRTTFADYAEKWMANRQLNDRTRESVRLGDNTTRTVPTARAGRGMRWRARYVDAEGRERTKAFRRKIDATQWLDGITAQFATGTYVKPEAGQVTVAAVYASWSASQGHISPKTAATRRSAWTSRVEPPWGGVAVIDVKTAAVRAWVSSMVADEVGAPTIENAFGLLRQVLGRGGRGFTPAPQSLRRGEAAQAQARRPRLFEPCTGRRAGVEGGPTSRSGSVPGLHRPAVGRDGRIESPGLRHAAASCERVAVGHRVQRPGVEHAEEPRTTLSAVPCTLADELAALMVGKDRDTLLFTNQHGGVLRNSNWRARVFSPAVLKCQTDDDSFPSITPHDLRHTAASLAVSAGANVKRFSGCSGTRRRR
jgi:hypothetical protein